MLEPRGSLHNGVPTSPDEPRGSRLADSPRLSDLAFTKATPKSLPKNWSSSSLQAQHAAFPSRPGSRFSLDGSHLGMPDPSLIRQQPTSRPPTVPSTGNSSPIANFGGRPAWMASPMTVSMPTPRSASMGMASGPASPKFSFAEDLSRFPSESLHSFSFAHQSEDFIHSRQNVLKRSVEFMSQRMNLGATNAGIVSAQARIDGDQEAQGMLELLAKAKLVGATNISGMGKEHLAAPLTGPALLDEHGNVFEQSFTAARPIPPAESIGTSPTTLRMPEPASLGVPIIGGSNLASLTEEPKQMASTPPTATKGALKRTYTDTGPLNLQNQLLDCLSQPYIAEEVFHDGFQGPGTSGRLTRMPSLTGHGSHHGSVVHGHASRWAPASQAIFTTECTAPYTILAANDLACLVFGVTKGEVRKLGILEFVQEDRRAWLQDKLGIPRRASESMTRPTPPPTAPKPSTSTAFLLGKSGVTASLLSKPNSRQLPRSSRRAQTDDGAGASMISRMKSGRAGAHHANNNSRGVLLCGDVLPIKKRNGAVGSASLWVKEKRGGLIWVLEEIHEDVVMIEIEGSQVVGMSGPGTAVFGDDMRGIGNDIGNLLPTLPRIRSVGRSEDVDFVGIAKQHYFTANHYGRHQIPVAVERVAKSSKLRVSSFPHIAGIIVLSTTTLKIISSNAVFSAALFGYENPNTKSITDLIPDFDRILDVLTEDDGIELVDGIVIPEHRFRRAKAFLSLRDGTADAAAYFTKPEGLPAKHRDGSEIKIDVQLRVVKSDHSSATYDENVIEESNEDSNDTDSPVLNPDVQEVFALWVTYSRHIHAPARAATTSVLATDISRAETPHQPSPGQVSLASPPDIDSDAPPRETSHAAALKAQLKAAAKKTVAKLTGHGHDDDKDRATSPDSSVDVPKKCIEDFVILEDMGQGAYGQVKLARYKYRDGNKVVLKYVTKRRILVDTWTRDRRLGTVPLEIHVLDFLRRDGFKHPNIVEMSDFFEDDVNYYIEMIPHGLPGMDLFDYIELRVNMDEDECRNIFVQVARAIEFLHTKVHVVHRDIKDENVVLDGEGRVKLIDFGSAAYIKSGPFDVFVGTIDYAAPEVLAGKPYRGKQQDVWALGILLYTIIYKENPFYSIDEIMDHDLRVPYVMSDDSIGLVKGMLDRDIDSRLAIEDVIQHPWCTAARSMEDVVNGTNDERVPVSVVGAQPVLVGGE